MSTRALVAVVLGLACVPGVSLAQMGPNPTAQVMQLNQQAMAAYGSLQFPQAMQILQQAQNLCQQYRLGGPVLARTFLNSGVVLAGGYQNNAAAMDSFKRALCLDPSILLDPLSSTPDLETLFGLARNQARAPGACGNQPAPVPAPVPPPPQYNQPVPPPPQYNQPVPPPPQYNQPVPPPPQVQVPMQILRHQEVLQQTRLTPIPLFVEVNPNVQVGKAVLFYRTMGERIYQQIEMTVRGSNGFVATIGCDVLQVLDPSAVEYYIAVLDPQGQLVGTVGSEQRPYQVAMVDQLSGPPPALPQEPPPSACTAECPPWNPDCNKSCAKEGDLCTVNKDCCRGMVCQQEFCVPGEGNDGDDYGDGDGGGSGDFDPFFRVALNAGTGFGFIGGGEESPYNQLSPGNLSLGGGAVWNKMHFRVNPMFYVTPDIQVGATFRGDLTFAPEAEAPKFGPAGLINLSYRLTGPEGSPDGFELQSLFGLGGGFFYHRVPYQDCASTRIEEGDDHPWSGEEWFQDEMDDNEEVITCSSDSSDYNNDGDEIWDGTDATDRSYFRAAGPFLIEAGLDAYYWFGENAGLNFGLIVDAAVPAFALNVEVQGGLALRF